MYDFWYSLGAVTMNPQLLTNINLAAPVFNFIPRVVVEVTKGVLRNGQVATRSGPSTGLIDRASTTKVRTAVYNQVKTIGGANTPPIGIYTAGRFCQLMNITRFQHDNPTSAFSDIINSSNKAYQTATNAGASALAAFPAALGMCLMDQQVVDSIQKYPNSVTPDKNALTEILAEFGVVVNASTDWDILRKFVDTTNADFKNAAGLLMAGDLNPWDENGNTLEQIVFWPDDQSLKGEHAIP